MYWLRWHYHVKDIAGAPYKIKKKERKKRKTKQNNRVGNHIWLYCRNLASLEAATASCTVSTLLYNGRAYLQNVNRQQATGHNAVIDSDVQLLMSCQWIYLLVIKKLSAFYGPQSVDTKLICPPILSEVFRSPYYIGIRIATIKQ